MHRKPRAFTLIELLVSISIIAILSGLFASSLAKAKATAKRAACQNNLRQLILGATMYSDDDLEGCLSNTLDDSDDNQNWLYPHYVPDTKVFICPNTRNRIRSLTVTPSSSELVDLATYAGNTTAPGSSYEVFGFMNYNGRETTELLITNGMVKVPGIRKTIRTVNSYIHKSAAYGLRNLQVGPSDIWLILDGDEPPGAQNFPDANNNHGASGGNVSFCDAHVEWITRATYSRRYELSQDEDRTGPE